MLTVQQKYNQMRIKNRKIKIPLVDTLRGAFIGISTKHENVSVKYLDSTTGTVTTDKNKDYTTLTNTNWIGSKTYGSALSGDVEVNFSSYELYDVYSVIMQIYHITGNREVKFNIQDFGAFMRQFPAMYSLKIELYAYQTAARMSVIKGDLADVPVTLKRYVIFHLECLNNTTDYWFNLSTLQNKSIEYIDVNFSAVHSKLIGDLGKLPSTASFIKFQNIHSTSAITYTAGKTWASNLETLSIPLLLTTTELDNLLIDMANSVTSVGSGTIELGGYRSPASDAAVAYLQGLGRTVNIVRLTRTLNLPLASDLLDVSGNANNAIMVGTESHSNSGLVTGTGKYAYSPSHTSLQIGTGSIAFGCEVKFNSAPSTGLWKGIIGKSIYAGTDGRYGIYVTEGNIGAITDIGANIINQTPITPYLDGNFHKIEVFCNRITGVQYLWIDGVLINTTTFTTNSTNFTTSARFAIGSNNDATGTAMLANSELDGIIRNVYFDKVV